MRVSLIATVLNEGESIRRLMDSIVAQTRQPDEIVICDGGSTDNTVEVIESYADRLPLRVIVRPGANISEGRNIAIAAATHDVIASTDAGVRLDPCWLERLVAPFEADPGVQVVAGFFLPDTRTPFEVAMGATVLPELRDIDPKKFMPSSRSVAYRRSARARDGEPYRAIFLPAGVLDLVVEDVLLAPGDVVVRAVSEANSIPGVPVRVYLENFLDQMVFSKSTVLASSTWDPQSGVDIDLVILQILNQANNEALNAGVALNPERRGAVLLPGNAFFDAIEASRNIDRPVEIRLVVAEDAWRSTSPILLTLEIL